MFWGISHFSVMLCARRRSQPSHSMTIRLLSRRKELASLIILLAGLRPALREGECGGDTPHPGRGLRPLHSLLYEWIPEKGHLSVLGQARCCTCTPCFMSGSQRK